MVPILPSDNNDKGYYMEATAGSSLHEQLSKSIDAIMRTATPIAEFNVYGHPNGCADPNDFCLAGVVSQRNWRSFEPPDGLMPCFPVSFILPHTDVGGVQRILLQNRTPLNTGGDFHRLSLISGKVNDEDFFYPNLPSLEYQQLAYQVSKESDDHLRVALSRMFARENGLTQGKPIPKPAMDTAWRNTAIRELGAELGLRIFPDRLLDAYPAPFLLNRKEGFQLFIKLYTLELQPEELAQIQKVRPHASLEPFTLEKMIEYKEKEMLSVFLCTHFDEYIAPLLKKLEIG
jgi:8-oxo-dGTP pyrophosphatase MutT (NUDIX family)